MYLKSVQQYTTTNEFGRVQYSKRIESDRSIVSYMPCLTLLMDSYVNIDVCFTGMPNFAHFKQVNWQPSECYHLSLQIPLQMPWQSPIRYQRLKQTEGQNCGLRICSVVRILAGFLDNHAIQVQRRRSYSKMSLYTYWGVIITPIHTQRKRDVEGNELTLLLYLSTPWKLQNIHLHCFL